MGWLTQLWSGKSAKPSDPELREAAPPITTFCQGQMAVLTCIFQPEGFDRLEDDRLVPWMNGVLNTAMGVVEGRAGQLHQFTGMGMDVFWSTEDVRKHPLAPLYAATSLLHSRLSPNHPACEVRLGLAIGEAIYASVGSRQTQRFQLYGKAATLAVAARESAPASGSHLVIDCATFEANYAQHPGFVKHGDAFYRASR